MRHFLLGSFLACLCGGAIAASAQLLNTHAGLGMLGSGGSGGAIAFVSAADLGNVNPGTALTQAYTVGSGASRLLVVDVVGDLTTGADDCSGSGNGVTYNGTAMTLRQKNVSGAGTSRFEYLFELLAPTSGSNNIVVTCGSSHYISAEAADYSGVVADDAVGQGNAGPATSVTIPITTVATGSWVIVGAVADYTLGVAYQSTGGSTVALTQRVIDSAFHIHGILDSAGTVSPGLQSIIVQLQTVPSVDYVGLAASYHP